MQFVTRYVADALAERRRARGMSKDELSRRCGISAPGIGLIENHKREATLYPVVLMSAALTLDLSRVSREAKRAAKIEFSSRGE